MSQESWDPKVEKILLEQKQKCAGYKWMHEEENKRYTARNKWMNIISIFIVSATATATSITGSLSIEKNNMYTDVTNVIYPIILYFTAVINALQQFLNYEKQAENHRTAGIRYNALYNNINRMLALNIDERQQVKDYFAWATKEYDNLFTSSPDICNYVINTFETKFKTTILANTTHHVINDDTAFKMSIVSSHVPETERIKYELDRFMVNSFN